MDIFLNRRHTYIVNLPFEDVRENIQSITTRKWSDFSENITGRLTHNANYVFTHKWSVAYIRGIEGMPAYLKVKLIKENESTKIETLLRPNSTFVIFFYLIAILFLLELIGINSFIEGSRFAMLLFLPAFDLILLGLMQLFTNGLRNRFEKIMHLQ
jgi:hypothetical protein